MVSILTLDQRVRGVSFAVSSTVLPYYTAGILLLDPANIEERTSDLWSLSQGSKSLMGNRPVSHLSLDGSIVVQDRANITALVKDWTDSSGKLHTFSNIQIGEPRDTRAVVQAVGSGNQPFESLYAGPWIIGGTKSRNFRFSLSFDGNVAHMLVTVEQSVNGAPWRTGVIVNDYYTLDWAGKRYRYGSSTRWIAMSAYDTGNLEPNAYARLENWQDTMVEIAALPDKELIEQDLVRRCALDAKYIKSNLYEFLKDLPSFGLSELKAIQQLGKVPNLKHLAGAHLSLHYGTRLTIAETPQLWGDIFSKKRNTSRAQERVFTLFKGVEIEHSLHSKVYYTTDDDVELIDRLQRWGILPDIRQIWEVIPLSFAVDWFTSLSERLSVFDAKHHFGRFPVEEYLFSHKVTAQVPAEIFYSGAVGQLSMRYYQRTVASHTPQPSYFDSNPSQFNNLVELGALIIQRN